MKIKIFFFCLFTTTCSQLTMYSQIPTNGLVAYYPFNGNTNDESGKGNNGILYGATLTEDRCSKPNSAYYFSGNYHYISLPPDDFILNVYSYSVWIKVLTFHPTSIDGWMIFSPGSSSNSYCQGLSIHPDGGILGTSYNIGNNPVGSWSLTSPIQTGKWYHIVYTRDYYELRMYINGIYMPNIGSPLYTPYTNNQPANYGSTGSSAIIGNRSNLVSHGYFHGYIDDLIIYNRVLTDEEILNLSKTSCLLSEITGEKIVCQSQQNVNFSIQSNSDFTSYSWNYSGSNVSIIGSANSISANFANNATSGVLKVTVTGTTIGTQSTEIPITVESCSVNPGNLNIPNAFSPNGDGINDFFVIQGLPSNSKLMIFDRLGKKLYESNNYQNDWDGKDNQGNVLVSGTYWYILSLSGIPADFKSYVYLKK